MRNNTGATTYTDKKGKKRYVRYGKTGSPDLIGIRYDGKFIGIECKTVNGKQSDAQKDFEIMVKNMNGIYILATEQEHLDLIFNDVEV